ncbi:MAG: FtsX-like permease family protein [Treponema sp.]|jgi:ABC-type lipoprotein release transport system permease subunit|nr:FtsX-like permease family protein [Treponema sp.]
MAVSSIKELRRLAFRNLSRHRVKSILTILAVSISVASYIFADGWLKGMNIDSLRNIANFEIGAAKLQTKAYFAKKDELPMYESFAGWEQSAAALDRAGFDSAPRFVFTGTIYSQAASVPMEFIGCDPPSEEKLLRYTEYMESGRYIQSGAFEMVLGAVTADKLKVGIPQRPTRNELDEVLLTLPPEEGTFVEGLYEGAPQKKSGLFDPPAPPPRPGEERRVLKKDIPRETMDRYWNLLAAAGRMNVDISTVIDIKAAPELVRKEKFDGELSPFLSAEEKALFYQIYEFDEPIESWRLVSPDEALQERILAAMIRADYSGALRHVNQLISVVVVGLVNSPNPKTNNNTGWIPLDVLQDEAGLMLEGQVTELLIRAKGAEDSALPGKAESAGAVKEALANAGFTLPPELDVFPWQAYVRDYLGALAGDSISTRIIVLILLVLSFLGIANTMLLAILERTRETGMMRAMGMTDGELVMTYMIEAGMVGFFGSLLGIIAGCLINIPMVKYGLDFSTMTEAMGGDIGYRVTGVFRSAWNVPAIIGSGIISTILASCMACFPTRKALAMPVTESLRFE